MKKTKPRSVAAFDLDGTLFREQLLILCIHECAARGLISQRAKREFEKLRRRHADRHISFPVYNQAIIDLFLDSIKGKKVGEFLKVARSLARKEHELVYFFSGALLATLRRTHDCITITGALREIVSYLAPYLGFNAFYATELETVDGRYTGRDGKLHVSDKAAALQSYVAATGASLVGSVALGDTISDAPMLAMVETPIAFNPVKELREQALRYDWPIVVERKDCLYVFVHGSPTHYSIDQVDEAIKDIFESRRARLRQLEPGEGQVIL